MTPNIAVQDFKKTNLAKAQALTPEYQGKLERIERQIRDEIAQDPALKPVYEVLRRQLQLPEDQAMELYSSLASRRAEVGNEDAPVPDSEEADDKSEKGEAATKANAPPPPPPPPPHIAAPSAPHATKPSPLPPRQGPPSNPLLPSIQPSETSSGAKRRHKFEEPQAAKKGPFVPRVSDWKCGACGWWNVRIGLRCGGKLGTCGVEFKSGSVKHQVQKEGPGVEKRRSGARTKGDWKCSCGRWNRHYWTWCGDCEKKKEECVVAEDWDEDLKPQDDIYSVPMNVYDYELHPEAHNSSSASRSQRYEYAASRGS